ncbi:MAG: radical SAM protein [Endomicrobiaceae bacterium]|nr:radical SAM protein [Endomicrobiaceae bacterium]
MNRFDELVEEAKKASNAGDFIKSNELYNQALICDTDFYIYFEIGKNYFYLNKYNDSEKYLNMYLQQENKQKEIAYYAILFLAKIYKSTGYFRKALLMCSQAKNYVVNDKHLDDLWDEINDINFLFYEKIPKQFDNITYEELEKKYIQSLNLNPNNQTAIVNLTELYLITRKYKKAVELVSSTIDKIPNDEVFFKNKLINFLETAQGKTKLISKPLRLGINLSNACNLQCIMCYVKDFKWAFPKSKIYEIRKFFPYLEKMMWQGGEVFSLNYFFDLLTEAAKYPNIQQGIITNAQLLNEKIIDLLVDMNLELTISVDGVNKNTYETIRKNASFEKLVRNMQYIANVRNKNNKNFTWGINFVVCNHNYNQLFSLFEIAHRYNVDFFCIMPLRDGAMTEIYDNNSVTKQITEIKKRSAEYNIQVENRVILLADDLVKDTEIKSDIREWISFEEHNTAPLMKKNRIEYVSDSIKEKHIIDYKSDEINQTKYSLNNLICHMPWQQMILDYDGTFWPDCQCRCDKNNNIIKFSETVPLSDIWNSKEMITYRTIITKDLYKSLCKNHCRDGKICDNYFSIDDMIMNAKELKDTRNIILDILYFIKNFCDDKQRDMYFERMYDLGITDERFLFQYARNLIASNRLDRLKELIEKSDGISISIFDFVNVIMDECADIYGQDKSLSLLLDLCSKNMYALNKAIFFINNIHNYEKREKEYRKLFDIKMESVEISVFFGADGEYSIKNAKKYEIIVSKLLSFYKTEQRDEILINIFYFIKNNIEDKNIIKKYYKQLCIINKGNKENTAYDVLLVYVDDADINIEDVVSCLSGLKRENESSFLNLARYCIKKRMYNEAGKIYNSIIKIDSMNADIYLEFAGILYYECNLFKDAEQILLKAISLDIGNLKLYIDLARIYANNGKTDKALKTLEIPLNKLLCKKEDLFANIKRYDYDLLYLKFMDYLNEK